MLRRMLFSLSWSFLILSTELFTFSGLSYTLSDLSFSKLSKLCYSFYRELLLFRLSRVFGYVWCLIFSIFRLLFGNMISRANNSCALGLLFTEFDYKRWFSFSKLTFYKFSWPLSNEYSVVYYYFFYITGEFLLGVTLLVNGITLTFFWYFILSFSS